MFLSFKSLFINSLFKQTNRNNLLTPTKFDSRKYLNSFVAVLVSLFVLYSFQETDLSNPLLRSFDGY